MKKEAPNLKGFYPTPPPKSIGEKLIGVIIWGGFSIFFFWILYPTVRAIISETIHLFYRITYHLTYHPIRFLISAAVTLLIMGIVAFVYEDFWELVFKILGRFLDFIGFFHFINWCYRTFRRKNSR